jgi:hypothetical protein
LPFTRSPPCNDYEKAEKSPVHTDSCERQKIDGFSSEINAVNGCTATEPLGSPFSSFSDLNDPPWGPFSLWPDDGLDIPPSLLRVAEVPLDRRPALGPEGDSLDDLET